MSDSHSDLHEHARKVLAQRARELAREDAESETATHRDSFMSFGLAGRSFAIPLRFVMRTVHIDHLTAIPCAPPHLIGLLTFDMNMVTLIDLVSFLGLSRQAGGDVTHAVVVGTTERTVALAADIVWGIEEISTSEIIALPTDERPFGQVVRSHKQEMPVLDVLALFDRLQ